LQLRLFRIPSLTPLSLSFFLSFAFAASYAGLSDWEKAADDGASCIRANKAFIKGYFRAVTGLENLKNYKKASETLTMGLAVEPRNKDLLAMKARIDELARAQKSQTLQEQAQALQKAGDIAGAFRALEQARAVDADNAALQQQFTKVKAEFEKFEKGRKMGLSPLEAIKEQGDDKYKNGMFEEAIALYTKCVEKARASGDKGQTYVKALSNRSACYKQANTTRRLSRARSLSSIFERTRTKISRHSHSPFSLTSVSSLPPLQLSDFDSTIEDTSEVIDIEPDNIKSLVRRAQAFEAVERYKLALQDVRTVIAFGVQAAGVQNFKLCNQMQARLSTIIEKLKSGNF
jgi:stress-induced-phosphoprotein 1